MNAANTRQIQKEEELGKFTSETNELQRKSLGQDLMLPLGEISMSSVASLSIFYEQEEMTKISFLMEEFTHDGHQLMEPWVAQASAFARLKIIAIKVGVDFRRKIKPPGSAIGVECDNKIT